MAARKPGELLPPPGGVLRRAHAIQDRQEVAMEQVVRECGRQLANCCARELGGAKYALFLLHPTMDHVIWAKNIPPSRLARALRDLAEAIESEARTAPASSGGGIVISGR